MRLVWRILICLSICFLLSGCPVDLESGLGSSTGGGSGGPTGSGGSSGSSSSGGTGGVTAGSQAFSDQLTEEFPGCAEPAAGDEWRAEILRLVNVERVLAGLPLLEHNQTLEEQAMQYACEMIYYDFFSHTNPVTRSELADRSAEFGIRIDANPNYYAVGENLAAGQTTPAQVMQDWLASPGHRDNILKPEFTQLGVGVRTGGRYGTYWVQEFGRPLGQ